MTPILSLPHVEELGLCTLVSASTWFGWRPPMSMATPLGEPRARDGAVRDYRIHLQTVARRTSAARWSPTRHLFRWRSWRSGDPSTP
jgi:hypothetical protein